MAWYVYALIYDGVVRDTWHTHSGADEAHRLARAVYGDNAFAVDCSYKYVIAGDTYIGGTFYHNGVEVAGDTNPQVAIENLERTVNQQSNDIDDLIIAVTPEVYGNV